MVKLGRLCGALMVVALFAASCGDDDSGDGDGGQNDTNGAVDDSAGAGDDDGGPSDPGDAGGSTDSGLPIPLPSGGEVSLSTATDRVVLYPADQFDSLVAFYDDWTGSETEEYVREELANGTISWDNQADAIEKTRGIVVAPDVGGQASVTLVAGPG